LARLLGLWRISPRTSARVIELRSASAGAIMNAHGSRAASQYGHSPGGARERIRYRVPAGSWHRSRLPFTASGCHGDWRGRFCGQRGGDCRTNKGAIGASTRVGKALALAPVRIARLGRDAEPRLPRASVPNTCKRIVSGPLVNPAAHKRRGDEVGSERIANRCLEQVTKAEWAAGTGHEPLPTGGVFHSADEMPVYPIQ
jgi:hypothetical protein